MPLPAWRMRSMLGRPLSESWHASLLAPLSRLGQPLLAVSPSASAPDVADVSNAVAAGCGVERAVASDGPAGGIPSGCGVDRADGPSGCGVEGAEGAPELAKMLLVRQSGLAASGDGAASRHPLAALDAGSPMASGLALAAREGVLPDAAAGAGQARLGSGLGFAASSRCWAAAAAGSPRSVGVAGGEVLSQAGKTAPAPANGLACAPSQGQAYYEGFGGRCLLRLAGCYVQQRGLSRPTCATWADACPGCRPVHSDSRGAQRLLSTGVAEAWACGRHAADRAVHRGRATVSVYTFAGAKSALAPCAAAAGAGTTRGCCR